MTKKLYIGLIIKRWYSRLLKRIISRPHTLKALLITLKIKKIISIHYSHRMYPCNQTTIKRKSCKLTWIEKNPLSSIFPEGCWNHMKVKQTNKQTNVTRQRLSDVPYKEDIPDQRLSIHVSYLQECSVFLTGKSSLGHPHSLLFIELMSDGGQIYRSKVLTLQQVVETMLGTERALLLQMQDSC